MAISSPRDVDPGSILESGATRGWLHMAEKQVRADANLPCAGGRMYTKSALISATFLALGCSSDPGMAEGELTNDADVSSTTFEYHDPVEGTVYQVNENRVVLTRELSSTQISGDLGKAQFGIGGTGKLLDATGRVEVQIARCDSGAYRTGSISKGCSVDSEYVLVGGGAEVDWQGDGALLWESRPQDTNNNGAGLTWLASSKDHVVPAHHRLFVFAVGLRLKRTDGTWMSHAALKNFVKYRAEGPSPQDEWPTVSCDAPTGTVLVGGGARAEQIGNGMLLWASHPESRTRWYAGAKDHLLPVRATVNAYCIGIQPTIPNFGTLSIEQVNPSDWVAQGTGAASSNVSTGYVPTSYGGRSEWEGSMGRMLYAMAPFDSNLSTFVAKSKDHYGGSDRGWTRAYAIQIRKQ